MSSRNEQKRRISLDLSYLLKDHQGLLLHNQRLHQFINFIFQKPTEIHLDKMDTRLVNNLLACLDKTMVSKVYTLKMNDIIANLPLNES